MAPSASLYGFVTITSKTWGTENKFWAFFSSERNMVLSDWSQRKRRPRTCIKTCNRALGKYWKAKPSDAYKKGKEERKEKFLFLNISVCLFVVALGRILSMKLINVVNWHSFLVLYLKGVFSSLFSPIKDNDCFHFVIDILIRLGKISHILCFLEVLIINSWLKVIFLHLLILFFLL